jgi:hypothetical protein
MESSDPNRQNDVLVIWDAFKLKEHGPSEELFEYIGSGWDIELKPFKEHFIKNQIILIKEEMAMDDEYERKRGNIKLHKLTEEDIAEAADEAYKDLHFFKYRENNKSINLETILEKCDAFWSPDCIIIKGVPHYINCDEAKDKDGHTTGIIL